MSMAAWFNIFCAQETIQMNDHCKCAHTIRVVWFHVNFQNTNINERKNNFAIGLSLPQVIELSLEMHSRFNLKSRLILLFEIWIYEKHCKRSAKQQMFGVLDMRAQGIAIITLFYWKIVCPHVEIRNLASLSLSNMMHCFIEFYRYRLPFGKSYAY